MKLRHFFEKIDDMEMGDVIKDFYKSDAPQFKGKSKKKRRQMAIAAKLSANESFNEGPMDIINNISNMSPEQFRQMLINLGMEPDAINKIINVAIKSGWENVKADPVAFANSLRQQNPQVFYGLAGVLGLAAVGGGFIVAKVGQGLKNLFTGKKSNESLQALARHVKEGVPLPDSLFRYQSEAYFDTFKQAKQLREMGSLPELDWESEEMLSTDIGESFELENGETVWLDVPYLDESEMPDLNDEMIGVPDNYYDEEERRDAFVDLQDALTGGWEDQYVIDGVCPNCAGTGYSDAEDQIYNDETDEYEEGLECDGWGPFGCDEGEMQGATWKEIIAFDQQNVDRQNAKDNYPGDEAVIQQIANMVKNMEDPRQVYRQMQVDYPHMGRAQRSSLIAKGMKAAGLTENSYLSYLDPGKNRYSDSSDQSLQRYLAMMLGIDDFTNYSIEELKDMLKTSDPALYKRTFGEANQTNESEFDVDNEEVIAKIIGKELHKKDWSNYTPYELYAELESVDPDKADFIKDLAKIVYNIRLQESKKLNENVYRIHVKLPYADGEGWTMALQSKNPEFVKDKLNRLMNPVQQGVKPISAKNIKVSLDGDDISKNFLGEADKKIVSFKTSVGMMPGYSDHTPLSFQDYYDWEMKTSRDKPKSNIVSQRYGIYKADFQKHISESINEAEYNGKKVKLNKPSRQSGGGKKYKVYVKNPKTGRVKKISFGDAGLKTKSGNKKRAKSFAARHNCEKKNDKMKAGYWACRLPRYGLVKGGKWW